MHVKAKASSGASPGATLREEAARQILDRYVVRLKNLVRVRIDGRVRQKAGTSDIVQSALISLFKGDHDFAAPDSLWPLLMTITLRKGLDAVDRYETAKRDFRIETSLSTEELDQLSAHPTADEVSELLQVLDGFLSSLPEREQKLVHLRLDGRSYEEIARELQMTEEAARQSFHRAKSKLQQMVKEFMAGRQRPSTPTQYSHAWNEHNKADS